MSNNRLTWRERAVLKAIIKRGKIRSAAELYELGISNGMSYSALTGLKEKRLIRRIPDLTDMRRSYYVLSEELASRPVLE